MNSREIILDVIRSEQVPGLERLPVALLSGGTWAFRQKGLTLQEGLNQSDQAAQILVDVNKEVQSDIVWPGSGYHNIPVKFFGGEIKFRQQGNIDVVKPAFQTLAAIDEIDLAVIDRHPWSLAIRDMISQVDNLVGQSYLVGTSSWGPFTLAGQFYGVEKMLGGLYKDKAGIHALLEVITEVVAVVAMEEAETVRISQLIVEQGIDAYEAIEQGLAAGMERAGQLFEEEEYFIPELLMCSDAMYAGLGVLKPHLKLVDSGEKDKIIIGVVEGDTHDIGKNIVKIMLETSGYEVIDLGRDVPPLDFIRRAQQEGAVIIAAATLMTTTLDGMQEIIRLLEEDQARNKFKVMIGGGPVSQAYADKIGADAYAANATEAVRKAKLLLAKQAV